MPPKYEYFEGEDLARNAESGIFYAVKHFRGLPTLNKSLGTKDKREAKRRLSKAIAEHLNKYQDAGGVGRVPTVAAVIDELERADGAALRAKTLSKRAFYFKRIRDDMDLGHLRIDKLTLPIWADRIEKLRARPAPEKGPHRQTFGDFTKHANILLRYAYGRKYISHLVTFPSPDKRTKVGTVLSVPELRLLWEVMGEDTRDQFVLGYQCAMRKLEALHLAWDRVDLDSGLIELRAEDVKTGSKTGKGREFYASAEALARLRARKARQDSENPSRWVFPSETGRGPVTDNKSAWNAAKARALKRMPSFQHWARWHDLRHTAITRMLVEQGINLVKVSEYVGTAADTLQRVYLHSKAEHTRGVNEGLRITDS